jgi:hypothetical protein
MCYVLINTVKHRLIESTGENLALAASDIADKLDTFFFERVAIFRSSPILWRSKAPTHPGSRSIWNQRDKSIESISGWR